MTSGDRGGIKLDVGQAGPCEPILEIVLRPRLIVQMGFISEFRGSHILRSSDASQ